MIWSLLVALLLAPPVDPAADQGTPFEYYAATETRLVPFAATPSSPRAPVDAGFRVLADGQLASPRGQFVIYLDDPPRPLAARVKRWLRPDLPVLQMTARAGDAQLQVQMLAGTPATFPEGVAMVRLSARATARSRLVVTAGWVPHPGHSARWPAHDLSARYGFADGAVWRDGRLLYQFPLLPTPTRLAAPEVTYAEPFTLREVLALRETPVGLVRYELALGPGQASQLVFRVPRADLEYRQALPLLRQADFDEALLQASREWSAWHGSQPTVTVPEEKVAAAYLAAQRRLRAWGAPPPRRSALSERLLAARLCRGLVMTRGR
ncbi:MAG: hypothetical protein HUU35_04840, partial [Armatimonadetes bacterium]|nr:hypothetical protein [Armatimonadota bacterium]